MLCNLCKGMGSFFVKRPSDLNINGPKLNKWFSCPSCNGVGTLICFSPPTIKIKNKLGKNLIKLNKKLDFEGMIG